MLAHLALVELDPEVKAKSLQETVDVREMFSTCSLATAIIV